MDRRLINYSAIDMNDFFSSSSPPAESQPHMVPESMLATDPRLSRPRITRENSLDSRGSGLGLFVDGGSSSATMGRRESLASQAPSMSVFDPALLHESSPDLSFLSVASPSYTATSPAYNPASPLHGSPSPPWMMPPASSKKRAALESDVDRPSKKMRWDFHDDVVVKVGDQSFHVPASILKTRSACLSDRFANGSWMQYTKIHAPTNDQETFATYLQLIMSGEIVLHDEGVIFINEHELLALTKLYILAEKLGDPTSMNLIAPKIITLLRSIPDANEHAMMAIDEIYSTSDSDSQLRRMVVEHFVAHWEMPEVADADYMPKVFMFDAVKEHTKRRVAAALDEIQLSAEEFAERYHVGT